MTDLITVTVSDGKYTMKQVALGRWEALRHGEPWPAFPAGPDNLHVALAYEVDTLRRRVAAMSAPEGSFTWALHLMLWEQKTVRRGVQPDVCFEFDGAEGGAFWCYVEKTDDLEKVPNFTADDILATDWGVVDDKTPKA